MDKRYLTCIILIILYVLTIIFRWLFYGQLDIFSLEMIITILIIMMIISLVYKNKNKL